MKKWKGIVLAGGAGTRLHPITLAVSKQLLPVFDKPMIYYPLSVLLLAGIHEILIIATPRDMAGFVNLFGDGSGLGVNISYAVQPSPDGLAQAFLLGEHFIAGDNCCLVLGDNIFYGQHFSDKLRAAVARKNGSTIFGYHVTNPERFGVIEFSKAGDVVGIEEKPVNPKSNYAVTGLYFYDDQIVEIAKSIKPSLRGELEITDVNQHYVRSNSLRVEMLGRGFAWFDTGTHESLMDAGQFVQTVEQCQGLKVACLEEIAFNNGWLSTDQLLAKAEALRKTAYGQYLMQVAKGA